MDDKKGETAVDKTNRDALFEDMRHTLSLAVNFVGTDNPIRTKIKDLLAQLAQEDKQP